MFQKTFTKLHILTKNYTSKNGLYSDQPNSPFVTTSYIVKIRIMFLIKSHICKIVKFNVTKKYSVTKKIVKFKKILYMYINSCI